MFADLINLFTLLATSPNRAVALIGAALVIVMLLFALELLAPLFVLAGLIYRASALPKLGASAPPPRTRTPSQARNAAIATRLRPPSDVAAQVSVRASDPAGSAADQDPIARLASAIREVQSGGSDPGW
jgi:hypothetical protein